MSKDIKYFFAEARKLKVDNCIVVLEKLSGEIAKEKNPDIKVILDKLLPAERTLLQDNATRLLEDLTLWDSGMKATAVKLKK